MKYYTNCFAFGINQGHDCFRGGALRFAPPLPECRLRFGGGRQDALCLGHKHQESSGYVRFMKLFERVLRPPLLEGKSTFFGSDGIDPSL